jgi:hypothetical protein
MPEMSAITHRPVTASTGASSSQLQHLHSSSDVTPFSYYFLPSLLDYLLMGLMVPILPLRLLLAGMSIFVAWCAGRLALCGITQETANAAPLTGWRRACRQTILYCSRTLFFSASIQRIEFVRDSGGHEDVGHFVDSSVAPIILSAPHFSYMDAFISGTVDITPVIKASAGKAPIFGRFLTALQPIFVNREKAERWRNAYIDQLLFGLSLICFYFQSTKHQGSSDETL